MTISMCNKICVTNRHLVAGSFLEQLERVVETKPSALILREKDLNLEDYRALAEKVLRLCRRAGVPCYLNSHAQLAIELGADGVQLSFDQGKYLTGSVRSQLKTLGISTHSPEEAMAAERFGADFVLYGHVFETDCKPGLLPRGLGALREVCDQVNIPVFAIGGIKDNNAHLCIEAGAAGVCMMSGYMREKILRDKPAKVL